MRFTRALRSLAVLLSFGFLGFAPGALAELLDDPIELGFLVTPGQARGVAVVGTLAYVADGTSGLRVIDVSDPALPVELGFLDTPDFAQGVSVVGTLAYVADGFSGLRVIDVSDPALPVELGFLDTPDFAQGVAVVGTLAYVADSSSGLRMIDSIVRVPEPDALLLGLTALGALAVLRRERSRRMEQPE